MLLSDFNDRVKEIDQFIRFLAMVEEGGASVHRAEKKTHRNKQIDDGCFKIMKASAFLLLYNLIESSIRSSFDLVYESIKHDSLSPSQLNMLFRDLWVRQRFLILDGHSASPRNYQEITIKIINDIFEDSSVILDAARLPVSGNLDAEEIRKICRKHGISSATHYSANGGEKLGLVKKQRNALAHGNASFVEVGRQFTVGDIDAIKQQTVVFVRSILRNILKFSERKSYLVET
ncbi:MAE_28990/MAE_18760 family HEPN-like nuclease [Pseudomonas sp. Q2-TVG4-2]|uniref:MAE_28990/MAE_18760 family HEPN-like nuclease n=1 Tax=Pseudomonas sp. Q2-TVG4-2 TaxID=1685699 RepID=UPI002159FB57|nr:MAE_28990/MAE_18760 family HEPN-like nuclease [Pseudomonas sp. Q2-TVG4-2]